MKVLARQLWNEPARFIAAAKAVATAALILILPPLFGEPITAPIVIAAAGALGLAVPEAREIRKRVRPIRKPRT